MNRLFSLLILTLTACEPAWQRVHLLPALEQQKTDLYWLADDAREGRLPGTRGANEAAAYIERRFTELQLSPASTLKSFRQSFQIPGKTTFAASTFIADAQIDVDYRPIASSASGPFSGKIAFAGYGAVSEKYNYDDYAGIDVTGRIVIAMRYEPHDENGKSRFTHDQFSDAAAINTKAQNAYRHGAKALLLVNPPRYHGDDTALRPFVAEGARFAESPIPIISVTQTFAQSLLGDHKLEDLQNVIDTTGKPSLLLLDKTITGRVDLKTEPLDAWNVVATLPGIGATKDETIVIGAHYDHIGRGKFSSRKPESGQIHNGADDNASGVSAMLGVARELANHRLNRSVIFVGFSGEESGLLGSDYFVKHPPVDLKNVVAMINLDMVGRVKDNTLFVGGAGTRPAFRRMLMEATRDLPLNLKSIGEGGFGPSDQQSFAIKQIPVLFFFTGTHAQYHHPDDDAPLINYDGLNQITTIVTRITQQLAISPREDYVSTFDASGYDFDADRKKPATAPSTTQSSTQPATQPAQGRASLGVIPDYGSDITTGGVRLTGSTPGTPAAAEGLKEGDILVQFGAQEIKNLYDLTDCLNQARPGDEIEIAYLREGKRVTSRVTLAARRIAN